MTSGVGISVGIMQGRLSDKPGLPLQSFPTSTWKQEFGIASSLGLDSLEWLIDGESDSLNPLLSETGRSEIKLLERDSGVAVRSVCYHSFSPLSLNEQQSQGNKLLEFERVVVACKELGAAFLVIPLMGDPFSAPEEDLQALVNLLQAHAASGVPEILLETDMDPSSVLRLLEMIGCENLGLVYDVGNANARRVNIPEEIDALAGKIREIHIKDRFSETGITQRLGKGDTPFESIASCLKNLGWSGPFVLETPIFDDALEEANQNTGFVKALATRISNL